MEQHQKTHQGVSLLSQDEAIRVDEELMSPEYGFTLDILMELAGQSVAHAVHHCNTNFHAAQLKRVLFVCGPGNNGGDGIVAARHLRTVNAAHYECTVLNFKPPSKPFIGGLLTACRTNNVNVHEFAQLFGEKGEVNNKNNNNDDDTEKFVQYVKSFDLVVDGLFGFSFKPPVRKPYDTVLAAFAKCGVPIFSIDIPSGWDVELGNTHNFFTPQYLISLTLPKRVALHYTGKHYIGGRFVPEQMRAKYAWQMPQYEGTNTFAILN